MSKELLDNVSTIETAIKYLKGNPYIKNDSYSIEALHYIEKVLTPPTEKQVIKYLEKQCKKEYDDAKVRYDKEDIYEKTYAEEYRYIRHTFNVQYFYGKEKEKLIEFKTWVFRRKYDGKITYEVVQGVDTPTMAFHLTPQDVDYANKFFISVSDTKYIER